MDILNRKIEKLIALKVKRLKKIKNYKSYKVLRTRETLLYIIIKDMEYNHKNMKYKD